MSKMSAQLFLGDARDAENMVWLKQNGVTHIINAAAELQNHFPYDFVYLNLNLNDSLQQPLHHALEPSFQFIVKAFSNRGIVFMHCAAGISRSASVILYFIMKCKHNGL